MKRCPECRRDYYDDTLLYCLDDGNALLDGPAVPPTDVADGDTIAMFSGRDSRITKSPGGEKTEILTMPLDHRPPRVGTRKASALIVGGLVILVVAAFLGYRFFARSVGSVDSVAVMPFINDNGGPDFEYLSDGMTEALIESLSRVPDLKVKSRASVFRYKDRSESPAKMGQELDVQAILNGRVVHRGAELILYLELIDTKTENVLWNADYKRPMNDLPLLQKEISQDVAQRINAKLTGRAGPSVAVRSTDDPKAYELYLKGRFEWNKRTASDLTRGIDYFNEATAIDPQFAQAYAGLAESYTILSYYSDVPPQSSYPKARTAAEKALQLDPNSGVAQADLAYVKFNYEWDFDGARKDFERAVELSPNEPTPHFWFGECLMYLGDYDRGIAEIKKARDLDPLSSISNSTLGWAYHIAGQSDMAIEQLTKTLEIDQNFPMTHFCLGMAYDRKGMYKESIVENQRSAELSGGFPGIVGLGHAYAASGQRDEALKIIAKMEEQIRSGNTKPSLGLAIIYAGLNDRDKAFEWLEKAFQRRDEGILYLKCQPYFDNLHSDVRYADLLKRIGFTETVESSGQTR
ncbi:MAG: tetratricopeptide repeat protein [Acidobacteriota bacterium]